MADPTTNYGWDLPNVGADTGTWGTLLNTILTAIDSTLKAVSDIANGALPKAGGALTGAVELVAEQYVASNRGNVSGALALDVGQRVFFSFTAVGNLTISFPGVPPAGKFVSIILEITNGGAYTISWPAGVKWPGGSAPVLTAAGVDVVTLYTRDAGVTWRGAHAMKDSR